MRRYRSLFRAVRGARWDPKITVPKGYLEAAQRALWTFNHQRVFDPRAGALAFLSPIPDTGLVPEQGVALPPLVPLPDGPSPHPLGSPECTDFLGPWLADDVVRGIAEGRINPLTKTEYPPVDLFRYDPLGTRARQPSSGRPASAPASAAASQGPASQGPGRPLRPVDNLVSHAGREPPLHTAGTACPPFRPPSKAMPPAAAAGADPPAASPPTSGEGSEDSPSSEGVPMLSRFWSGQQGRSLGQGQTAAQRLKGALKGRSIHQPKAAAAAAGLGGPKARVVGPLDRYRMVAPAPPAKRQMTEPPSPRPSPEEEEQEEGAAAVPAQQQLGKELADLPLIAAAVERALDR